MNANLWFRRIAEEVKWELTKANNTNDEQLCNLRLMYNETHLNLRSERTSTNKSSQAKPIGLHTYWYNNPGDGFLQTVTCWADVSSGGNQCEGVMYIFWPSASQPKCCDPQPSICKSARCTACLADVPSGRIPKGSQRDLWNFCACAWASQSCWPAPRIMCCSKYKYIHANPIANSNPF